MIACLEFDLKADLSARTRQTSLHIYAFFCELFYGGIFYIGLQIVTTNPEIILASAFLLTPLIKTALRRIN